MDASANGACTAKLVLCLHGGWRGVRVELSHSRCSIGNPLIDMYPWGLPFWASEWQHAILGHDSLALSSGRLESPRGIDSRALYHSQTA